MSLKVFQAGISTLFLLNVPDHEQIFVTLWKCTKNPVLASFLQRLERFFWL